MFFASSERAEKLRWQRFKVQCTPVTIKQMCSTANRRLHPSRKNAFRARTRWVAPPPQPTRRDARVAVSHLLTADDAHSVRIQLLAAPLVVQMPLLLLQALVLVHLLRASPRTPDVPCQQRTYIHPAPRTAALWPYSQQRHACTKRQRAGRYDGVERIERRREPSPRRLPPAAPRILRLPAEADGGSECVCVCVCVCL
jgi:hypothetical protein